MHPLLIHSHALKYFEEQSKGTTLDSVCGFMDHFKIKLLTDSHYMPMTGQSWFLMGQCPPKRYKPSNRSASLKTLEKSFFEGEISAIKVISETF